MKDAERPWASFSLPCRRPQLMRRSWDCAIGEGRVSPRRPCPRSGHGAAPRTLPQPALPPCLSACSGTHRAPLRPAPVTLGVEQILPPAHTPLRGMTSRKRWRVLAEVLCPYSSWALCERHLEVSQHPGAARKVALKSRGLPRIRAHLGTRAPLNPFRDICQQNTSNLGGSRSR